jgi:hypothetical protein
MRHCRQAATILAPRLCSISISSASCRLQEAVAPRYSTRCAGRCRQDMRASHAAAATVALSCGARCRSAVSNSCSGSGSGSGYRKSILQVGRQQGQLLSAAGPGAAQLFPTAAAAVATQRASCERGGRLQEGAAGRGRSAAAELAGTAAAGCRGQ